VPRPRLRGSYPHRLGVGRPLGVRLPHCLPVVLPCGQWAVPTCRPTCRARANVLRPDTAPAPSRAWLRRAVYGWGRV